MEMKIQSGTFFLKGLGVYFVLLFVHFERQGLYCSDENKYFIFRVMKIENSEILRVINNRFLF